MSSVELQIVTTDAKVKRGTKRKRSSAHRRISSKDANNALLPEYEVEKIVEHRIDYDNLNKQGNYVMYNIKWKDWDEQFNTWESFDNLTNCLEMIVKYYDKTLGIETATSSQIDAFKTSLCNFKNEEIEELAVIFLSEGGDCFPCIDVKDLEERIELTARLPRIAREPKFVKELRQECIILEIKRRREHQLKNLAQWEEEINSTSPEGCRIRVENYVDLDIRPLDFKYINKYLSGLDEEIPEDPPIGCECSSCCSRGKCSCAEQCGGIIAYNSKGLLRVPKGTPIYECNKKCSCSIECPNRVLQNGTKVKLSIFRTSNGRGWGVKTLEQICKGQFVIQYIGEVITSKEADRRGRIYDRQGRTYLFDLDFNGKKDCPYTVDAAEYGNVSHFINHSCSPNLDVYAVWVDCLDPDIPLLGLYANRNIKPNEEITFDYLCQPLDKTDKREKGTNGVQESKVYCKCDSANCRVYLF